MKRFLIIYWSIALVAALFAESAPAVVKAQSGDGAIKAIDVPAAMDRLKARMEWNPLSGIGLFEIKNHRAIFRINGVSDAEKKDTDFGDTAAYTALLDGVYAYRGPGPYMENGQVLFPQSFIEAILAGIQRRDDEAAAAFKVAAILIDAGHGGKDTGAVAVHEIGGASVEVKEKDINLRSAKMIFDLLSARYPEKRIFLSRSDDSYLTLEQRVAIANGVVLADNEAIVFISIHANASFNRAVTGYEVWYLSPRYRRTVVGEKVLADSADLFPILNTMMEEAFTTESLVIAKSIMTRLGEKIGSDSPSRGIKAEEWFVVRNAKMPSVLIELGFVTNSDEAKRLLSDEYLRRTSEAVYNGVMDFVTVFESSGGFTGVQ